MTASEPSRVAEFMRLVLRTVEETFLDAEVILPERRYITFGTPAADCDQVTVALQQIYLGSPGQPAQEPSPCSAPTSAVLRVEILRPVPIPQDRQLSVPVDALQASAEEQIRDAELLLESVRPMCNPQWGGMGVFADVLMGTEAGAYAGPVMNLTAGIP